MIAPKERLRRPKPIHSNERLSYLFKGHRFFYLLLILIARFNYGDNHLCPKVIYLQEFLYWNLCLYSFCNNTTSVLIILRQWFIFTWIILSVSISKNFIKIPVMSDFKIRIYIFILMLEKKYNMLFVITILYFIYAEIYI